MKKRLSIAGLAIAVMLSVGFLRGGTVAAQSVAEREANLWKEYNEALKGNDPQAFRLVVRKAGIIMRDYPTKVNVADLLFLLGLCYENTFDFKKALVYYRELLNIYPYHKNAKAVKYKINLIEKSYKKEADSLSMFVEQERLMLTGKYREAIDKCRKLISTYPSSSLADNAQNVIGYVSMTFLKDYQQGRREYEKLLALYPGSAFYDNAIFAVGRCLEEMGFYESSKHYYKKLIKKHKGLLFSKTDYWSRVWHTRAEEQLNKVDFKLRSKEGELYAADSFVELKERACVRNMHGAGDMGRHSVQEWVNPEDVAEVTKRAGLPVGGLGDNTLKLALKVWNFVAEKYPYVKTVGGADYWQFPAETVQRRSGDGADLSFFMASLLINGGVDRNKVWVMLGRDKSGAQHFWVTLHHDGEWYFLEPSWSPPFEELPLAKFEEGYTPCYAFNDRAIKINPRIKPFLPTCK